MAVRERPSAGRIDAHGHGRVKLRQAVGSWTENAGGFSRQSGTPIVHL
jgi:hypothetical protein